MVQIFTNCVSGLWKRIGFNTPFYKSLEVIWRLICFVLPSTSVSNRQFTPFKMISQHNINIDVLFRFFRRRVASLSSGEINIRDKADVVGVKQPVVDDPTMRTELFSPWQETVVVDLEEYTSMANELADIKSKLVDLQTLLVSFVFGILEGDWFWSVPSF